MRERGLLWETKCDRHPTPSPVSLSLQCDGVPMPLPSLQGLAVLNIPSYAGGINFWGGTKEDNVSVTKERSSKVYLLMDVLRLTAN